VCLCLHAGAAQAIENAVNNGASLGSTFNAGRTGSLNSWATSQGQQTFNAVQQVTAPTFWPAGR
jgi:hypothetical protein